MKEDLSAFDISVLSRELTGELAGYYVDNVYQINPLALLIKLNSPGASAKQLLIEAGKRVHLTRYQASIPQQPSQFCRALRKILANGKVIDVRQEGFERILTILIRKAGNFRLLVELFARGNILVLDDGDIVLRALSYRRTRERKIVLNEKYFFPISKGLEPRQVTPEALEVLHKAETDTVRALTKHLAIGGTYAEEFLKRAEIDKETLAKNLSPGQIKRLTSEIQKVAVQLEMPQAQVVLDKEGNMLDVTPFPLAIYTNNKTIPYSTLSAALDDYFSKLAAAKKTELVKREFESQKEEATRIQAEQTKRLKQLEQDTDNFRIVGQAIRDNSFEFQELIHLVAKKRNEGKNWPDIERDLKAGKTPQAFTGLEPIRKAISLRFGDLKGELDIRLSAYENASQYFERSKEAKAKSTSVTRALADTEEKKTSAESRTAQLAPQVPIPLREKTWYEKFHHFFTSENFLVVGGRDSSSNEVLIKRHTSPEDIVLHAEIIGAPFTVIKTAGRNPSEQSILEAAQFGACYSRAWRELVGSVDMYWIQPTQLSKSPPTGQYLARGAFMIYGKRNYLRKIPLKLAVGFTAEPNPKLFGGTPSSVSQKTQNLVEIVPGNIEAKVLCEKIKRDLAQKAPKEHRPEILRTSIESMRTLIPFGKALILASASRNILTESRKSE